MCLCHPRPSYANWKQPAEQLVEVTKELLDESHADRHHFAIDLLGSPIPLAPVPFLVREVGLTDSLPDTTSSKGLVPPHLLSVEAMHVLDGS